MIWELYNATIVTEKEPILRGSITIDKDRILRSGPGSPAEEIRLNLHGMVAYPGFINAHDHLLSTYLPKIGRKAPYLNWLSWDNDLKASVVFAERQQLDPEQLYFLGAYRNLLSGVTAIQDHIPEFVNESFRDNLPVRLIYPYSICHSICNYSLGWGEGIKAEYQRAEANNIPFVTHIAEGFDSESKEALDLLEKQGGLGENTVLVSGVSLSENQLEKIAKKKVHLVWIPSSNQFLFQKTLNVKAAKEMGINISLGTDTVLSGSLHLLEEMRFARQIYEETFRESLAPEEIFKMVSVNPAQAFRRIQDLGSIKAGKKADLVVLEKNDPDPFENLLSASLESVRLVVIDGLPVYGDENLSPVFDSLGVPYESVKIGDREKIVAGSPKSLLRSIHKSIGYKKDLAFLPISSE